MGMVSLADLNFKWFPSVGDFVTAVISPAEDKVEFLN